MDSVGGWDTHFVMDSGVTHWEGGDLVEESTATHAIYQFASAVGSDVNEIRSSYPWSS